MEIFTDVDYASKAIDRRSVSGGAIICGGAYLCWFPRTQKFVTLSISEAEYVALGDAVKELFLSYTKQKIAGELTALFFNIPSLLRCPISSV